jgi:Coenzyme PQQ synthesis protein D (PqqD)
VALQLDTICLPSSNAAYRIINDQAVIVHIRDNRLITLNETGSAVWNCLDGRELASLVDEVTSLFEVSDEQAFADVVEFIETMLARGLVVEKKETCRGE